MLRQGWLLGIVLCLCIGIGSLSADAPAGTGRAPVGSSFTYQGRLTDGGSPANGNYDLQFRLYDDLTGGNQIGSTVNVNGIAVTDGLFTTLLDFGATAFAGQARWLEVAVRPAGGGSYTTLNPRQPLTASPYALHAEQATTAITSTLALSAPWSGLTDVPAGFADEVDNDTQYSAGTGITLSSSQFSLTASYRLPQGCGSNQIARWVGGVWICDNDANSGGDITSITAGNGLTGGGTTGDLSLAVSYGGSGSAITVARSDHIHFGQSWTGNATYGLQVTTNQDNSVGLRGETNAATYGSGVSGVSAAANGVGVHGLASSTTGDNVGTYGQSNSLTGIGVRGYAFAVGTGTSYGIHGTSNATTGVGVYGLAFANSGGNKGVQGVSNSATGIGVYGLATSTVGTPYGVIGEAPSNGFAGYFSGRTQVYAPVDASATSVNNHAAAVVNNSSTNTNGPDVLALSVPNVNNPDGSVNYITFFDQGGAMAAIEGNGSGGVSYVTSGADVAEYMPLATNSAIPQAGDVVGLTAGRISHQTTEAGQAFVVSGNAGFVGNMPPGETTEGAVLVALMGQVQVRVQGTVRAGDYLIPSGRADGTALALPLAQLTATQAHLVIGQALTDAQGTGEQQVLALVGQPHDTLWANLLSHKEAELAALETRLSHLETQSQTAPSWLWLIAGLGLAFVTQLALPYLHRSLHLMVPWRPGEVQP